MNIVVSGGDGDVVVHYTEGFKARMIERLAGPDPISATALSKQVGMSQATLSRWLKTATTITSMGSKKSKRPVGASPRKWSGVERLQVVLEAAAVPVAELGELLRRKGIHETDLKAWREAARAALEGEDKVARHSAAAARGIKELDQDIAKKDKRLKAVNALLELQKKSGRSGETRKIPLRRGADHDPAASRGGARGRRRAGGSLRNPRSRRDDGAALAQAPGRHGSSRRSDPGAEEQAGSCGIPGSPGDRRFA
jgi:transposase